MSKQTDFTCSKCSAAWRKSGSTNCWSSDPENPPSKPGNCPTRDHSDVINEAFELYRGDADDARMASVAARVEGLCYQPIPGSDAINARWTRVEDTIAFAAYTGEGGAFSPKFLLSRPKENSLEDIFHRYERPFLFVDLRRSNPFKKPFHCSPMSYNRTMIAPWPYVVDAIFFIDSMTSTHPIPP